MNSVMVIETASQFADFIEQLLTARHIAIDTESNSFYAYFERICLIQISTTERDYILDPLALKDLDALGRIMEDPEIEKIFHAASNDVLGLKRDLSIPGHAISLIRLSPANCSATSSWDWPRSSNSILGLSWTRNGSAMTGQDAP